MKSEELFEKLMNLELQEKLNFDFSNMGREGEPIDLFFHYMAAACKFKEEEKSELYQKGVAYAKDCLRDKIVLHPDCNSTLLHEIYKCLWGSRYLEMRTGETMNSANTTLDELYEICMESLEEKRERQEISSRQQVSIKYILSRYASDREGVKTKLETISGLKKFLASYHTLGNFLPVPKGCNASRGICILKDYWDLTLACIYNWYAKKEGRKDTIKNGTFTEYSITMIFKKEADLKRYEDWLNGYDNWYGFVAGNFFGDYWDSDHRLNENFVVGKKDGDGIRFGRPRELWEGHFAGAVMPKSRAEFESFFVYASAWIESRGKLMIEKLMQDEKSG